MQMGLTSDRKKNLYDISRIEDQSQDSIQLRCSDPSQNQNLRDSLNSSTQSSNDHILLKLPSCVFDDVTYQK